MIKLKVLEKAYQAALEIHQESLRWPKFEQFELAAQVRRASKSICSNLVEGFGKDQSTKEKAHFVRLCIGSNDEVKLWLRFAKDLGYLNQEQYEHFQTQQDVVGKMLFGLKSKLTT